MKHLVFFTAVTLAALMGVQGTASAQLLTTARCQNAFNVLPDTAQRRFAWGLFCKDHPGPDAAGIPRPGSAYMSDASITDYNTSTAALKQVLFPTYFDFVNFTAWDVPATALTPTTVASNSNPTLASCLALPTWVTHAGLCVAGCYVEGTQLQFADGPMGIKAAALSDKADLVTLSATSTLDNLQFATNKVERYVTDVVEDWQTIFTLSMKSGGQLRVTTEHPLLTTDGVIHQARGLKIGDQLIRANGKPDAIVNIQINKEFGKVYNVKPVTTDYVSNIVVAGGYLNGSLRYQNEFLDMINALILRRTLSEQAGRLTTN